MTRSVWKGPYVDPSLLRSTEIQRKLWSRRSCILPQFVGCFTQIYNGTKWIGLKITEDMVGHKFGEFASTRAKQRPKARSADKARAKQGPKARKR